MLILLLLRRGFALATNGLAALVPELVPSRHRPHRAEDRQTNALETLSFGSTYCNFLRVGLGLWIGARQRVPRHIFVAY